MNFNQQLAQFIEEISQGNYVNFRNAIAQGEKTKLNLEHMKLKGLPDTFYGHLAIALQGTNVTTVNLKFNKIGPVGAANFARNLQGTNVTTIDLSLNNIGPAGAANVARNLQGTKVTTVDLSVNNIGFEGAANFIRNLQGTNVTTVDLYGNNIGPEGTTNIALSLHGTKIMTVRLYFNNIGPEGAANFARNLQGSNVTTIDLGSNNIGPEGAVNVARNLQGTNVTNVNLTYNKIGSKGAANFARNLQGTNVTNVKLSENDIGSEGAAKFVRNLKGTRVTTICLTYNPTHGLTSIIKFIPFTNLTEIIGHESADLSQALNKNIKRLEQRKAALEIAYSAHCHFDAPSTEKAYPQKKEQTQESTQYAMGIIANLQNNNLMNKILGYLPSMEDDRPAQCVELVADRKKPEPANVKKRNLQDDASKSKRQAIDALQSVSGTNYLPQASNPHKRIHPNDTPGKRSRISEREIKALGDTPRLEGRSARKPKPV